MPQENGSHYGCEELRIENSLGDRLTVEGADFSFNASHYTQEELTKKQHSFELEDSGYTVLCIDERQSGIGSNSCGPALAPEYRFSETAFTYTVRLKPAFDSDLDPFAELRTEY